MDAPGSDQAVRLLDDGPTTVLLAPDLLENLGQDQKRMSLDTPS